VVIDIPSHKTLDIRHIVCDYNGTIAKDGKLLEEVPELFHKLSERYTVHVVTADTFGSVEKELEGTDANIKILTTTNHTKEKEDFVQLLGADRCAAVGNGSNDADMLKSSAIGISIVGGEGCSTRALMNSDLACNTVRDALELFLYPKRLIASLRR